MKKYWTGCVLLLGLFATLSAHSQEQKSDVFNVLKGTQFWGLVQSDNTCIEKYNFLPSGEILVSSHLERITGQYSFLENTQSFELPAVVINFKTDNRQPDCAGNSINQAGTSTTNFLKKVSDKEIYFCNDALGKDCPVYLRPEH
ncbi:hypothetical protein AMD27_00180 [Acinetobacter sp. TGL-Y2]|uniref:hypothetical protein n=1 Tax=Acinetobacter sp. TGL-Y2 TaxID=1407071 RepID=UPI0007A657B9|nr:hypothetical protein [Acinetobacter sp. TGL-Y2]AMW77478.1 hypothetical protein AMD27_00180 [Acinetobacter sp. TGL-Y2]